MSRTNILFGNLSASASESGTNGGTSDGMDRKISKNNALEFHSFHQRNPTVHRTAVAHNDAVGGLANMTEISP
jgi:hypothetical protein